MLVLQSFDPVSSIKQPVSLGLKRGTAGFEAGTY
jgi:hypothetical protein